jgi:hypothetical protein
VARGGGGHEPAGVREVAESGEGVEFGSGRGSKIRRQRRAIRSGRRARRRFRWPWRGNPSVGKGRCPRASQANQFAAGVGFREAASLGDEIRGVAMLTSRMVLERAAVVEN